MTVRIDDALWGLHIVYVQYDKDEEVVFHHVSLKVSDMLAKSSPQKPINQKRVMKNKYDRDSSCPVTWCNFLGIKLKFQVQTKTTTQNISG